MEELNIKVECFNLKYTLECGQCFRWKYIEKQDAYIGVISDRVVKVKQSGKNLFVSSNNFNDLEQVVTKYFNLDKDYISIEKRIREIDENISQSVNYSSGIRILVQPLFETIISYIISANNNIKRISKSVDKISDKYGDKIYFEGKEYHLFPTLKQLSMATTEDLLACGVGFRARYITNTTKRLIMSTNILEELRKLPSYKAREVLLEFQGIGPKVADCILLFALERVEVFPIDVWVKRIIEKLYFKENTKMKDILEYAQRSFGKDAGIVQQHLFYNVREGNI